MRQGMDGYKNIHAVVYNLKLILTHFQLAADCDYKW